MVYWWSKIELVTFFPDGNEMIEKKGEIKDLTEIKRIVAEECESRSAIASGWLFGSAAKSSVEKVGDIDIAILLGSSGNLDFFLPGFMAQIEKRLPRQVDVVVLDRAGEVLKYEVRRSGLLIVF